MSDTATVETTETLNETETPTDVTEGTEEEKETRTRYSGPVMVEGGDEEEIDLNTVAGRGRPSVDLTPYIETLKDNFKKNEQTPWKDANGKRHAKRPETNKVVKIIFVEPVEALSSVKSRFNSAGAECKIGIRWVLEEVEEVVPADGNTSDMKTRVRLGLVAAERREGVGRKPAAKSTPIDSQSEGEPTK